MFENLKNKWQEHQFRRRRRKVEMLNDELKRWRGTSSYYRSSLDMECTSDQWYARQKAYREAADRVESLELQILTIETPQARVVSE